MAKQVRSVGCEASAQVAAARQAPGEKRSGAEPTIAADKSLLARRLAGAYRRPGAIGAVASSAYRDGAGSRRASCPPSAVAGICS
jgi:hypothetical protein